MSRLICPNRTIRLDQDSWAARGLVGWWPTGNRLSWGTGTLRDCSLNGNHGTLLGTLPTWQLTQRAFLQFAGSGYSRVKVPFSSSLNSDYNTMVCWCNPSRIGGQDPLVQKAYTSHGPPGYQYFLYLYPVTELGAYYAVNGVLQFASAPGVMVLNQWQHLAATYDGSTIRVYRNGVQVGSANSSGTISQYETGVVLGAYDNVPTGEFLTGGLDHARVYSRVWTPAEVMQDFRETQDGGYGSLAWRRRLWPVAAIAAGQPMMRRWGGIPHMTPGPVLAGRSW